MSSTIELIKIKTGINGQPQIEINENLIAYLSEQPTRKVNVITFISENTSVIEQIVNNLFSTFNFTLAKTQTSTSNFQFNLNLLSGLQLIKMPLEIDNESYIFICFDMDVQNSQFNLIQMCLVLLMSTLVIYPIEQDFTEIYKFVELNLEVSNKYQKDNIGSQIANLPSKIRKCNPSMLFLKDSLNDLEKMNIQIIYDKISEKFGLKNAIQFEQIFRRNWLIQSPFKKSRLQDIQSITKFKKKKIGSCQVTQERLLSLILNFCDNFNSNKKALEAGVYSKVQSTIIRKIIDLTKTEYQEKFKEFINDNQVDQKILVEQDELDLRNRDLFQKILIQFDQSLQQFSYSKEIINERKELITKIQNDYEILNAQNYEQSKEYCSEFMNNLFQQFKLKDENKDDLIQNKNFFIREKCQYFEEIMQVYLDDAKGPFKYKTIAEHVPSFLLERFDSWFETLISYFTEETNKNKAIQLSISASLKQQQQRYQESEQRRFELENQVHSLNYDLENQKREVNKIHRLKEIQEEQFNVRIQEYQNKYERQKEKKKSLKDLYEDKLKENRQLQTEMLEKNKSLANYMMRSEQLEKALEQTILKNSRAGKNESILGLQEELVQLFKQFKENVAQAEDQIKRQRESNSIDNSMSFSQGTTWKRSMDIAEKQIDKLKIKNKNLKEKNAFLQKEKEDLEKKNQDLEKENIELKQIKILYPKNQQSVDKIDQELKIDEHNIVQQHAQEYNDFLQVLQQQKQKIESQSNEIEGLSLKYCESSYKIIDLSTQKSNLITLLRELLKLVQKRQNNLNIILNSLPLETQKEIKDILRNFGVIK